MSSDVHGWRRGLRWTKWILLGLLYVTTLLLVAAVAFIHTDFGRDKLRAEVEARLSKIFVGGASIAKLEGSPFGRLVVRDLVIDGPDHQPAIKVATLQVRVRLFALIEKDVRLDEVIAEGVDVAVKRDATGKLELAQLTKPSEEATSTSKSSWTIDLPSVQLHRAHVMVDSGSPDAGIVDLDDLEIAAHAHLPPDGERSFGVELTTMWRQRNAPLAIAVSLRETGELIAVPTLRGRAGAVTVTGDRVEVIRRGSKAPLIAGHVTIGAPAAAVTALVPRVELPGDIALTIDASGGSRDAQPISIAGTVGPTPIQATVTADLDARHIIGGLHTGDFDLAAMTHGKVAAAGGVDATFDVEAGTAGQLPIGTVQASARASYQNVPRSTFGIAIESRGDRASTTIDVSGAARARIEADVIKADGAWSLERASLAATTADLASSSGGKAPIHGALDVQITAHGRLTPKPDLAVAGAVKSKRLRINDLSAALDVAIDARSLPAAAKGTVDVRLSDVTRKGMPLGMLAVHAADRPDGKFQVNVTSHPTPAPWIVELAALVTPPAPDNSTVVVELQHHHIRAGNGVDWTGSTGRLVVGATRIELRDLRSASADGAIAMAGSFVRAGAGAGDFAAKLDVDRFGLDALHTGYGGVLGLHVDVARTHGRLTGTAATTASNVRLAPQGPVMELSAKLVAKPGTATLDASASSKPLGAASVAIDVATPGRLDDVVAWKATGREALRNVEIHLHELDVHELAGIVSPGTAAGGKLDGTVKLSATAFAGHLEARAITSPKLQGIRQVDASLDIAQTAANEVSPALSVKIADVGHIIASADLAMPPKVFDLAAWKAMGPKLVRAASVHTDKIAIDPAMLDRINVRATARGTASFQLDVGEGLSSVKLAAVVDDLRGSPIARPVSIHLDASIDEQLANASLAMTSQGKAVTLIKLDGHVPVSIDRLRAEPRTIKQLPVEATLELPQTSASQLLNVFGRSDLVGGTLDGKIAIAGTLGKPTIDARIVGDHLRAAPGPNGESPRVINRITIAGRWDGHGGKLAIDGAEEAGGTLELVAQGQPGELGNATATIRATTFDLAPLLAFAPGPAGGSHGTLDANLTIKGFDPKTANVTGELHVHDARIPLAPTVGTLRQANIDIAIHPHDIALQAMGKLGGGDIRVDGTIALDGAALTGGNAKLTLRKVSPIGAVEPQVDADITAKIGRKGRGWTAAIVVDNGFVKVTKKSGEKLRPTSRPSDLLIGKTAARPPAISAINAAPEDPTLTATITLHDTKVESEEFRTTLQGTLEVTADATAIGAKGSIKAESGDLDLFDRRYRVEQAEVTFDGTIDPRLAVRITYDFPDVTTTTEVRGRMSKPELVLSANPGLYTQSQLLGFLLGGEPGGDPSSGGARDKIQDAGTSFIASQIGGFVKKALPFDIDVIRYEAASLSSSAAITVGTWITHTLFFAFRQHLDARPDENSGEASVEYWVTRRLELEGTAGDRNYDGLDMLWRKRF